MTSFAPRRRPGVLTLVLILPLVLGVFAWKDGSAAVAPRATTEAAPILKIEGDHFVDALGEPMRIFAVHFGTSEHTCVEPRYDEGAEVFSIPTSGADLEAVRSWHANTVRIPLNEQCWLGVNPVKRFGYPDYRIEPLTGDAAERAGRKLRTAYRSAIADVVQRAHAAGLAVVLDLHWSAAGNAVAFGQWPLPDRQYSVPFWRSVAHRYRDDPSVAFEIFNEPFLRDGIGGEPVLRWGCLRNGCTVRNACADCGTRAQNLPNIAGCGERCPTENRPLGTYRSAGTQDLVDAIRSTGATQPILVPGRYYTNDLAKWAEYAPDDPLDQLAATFHNYEGLPCDDAACWDTLPAAVSGVPIVTTEFGGDLDESQPCQGVVDFDETYMAWADDHGVSYGAFSWGVNWYDHPTPTCSYDLLADYPGTPRYGQGQAVHDHFALAGPG